MKEKAWKKQIVLPKYYIFFVRCLLKRKKIYITKCNIWFMTKAFLLLKYISERILFYFCFSIFLNKASYMTYFANSVRNWLLFTDWWVTHKKRKLHKLSPEPPRRHQFLLWKPLIWNEQMIHFIVKREWKTNISQLSGSGAQLSNLFVHSSASSRRKNGGVELEQETRLIASPKKG